MLQMTQTMIERRPLTLHLVNTNKQTQAINIGQAAHGVADYKAFTLGPDSEDHETFTLESVATRSPTRPRREPITEQEDWSPPRLFLGSQPRGQPEPLLRPFQL